MAPQTKLCSSSSVTWPILLLRILFPFMTTGAKVLSIHQGTVSNSHKPDSPLTAGWWSSHMHVRHPRGTIPPTQSASKPQWKHWDGICSPLWASSKMKWRNLKHTWKHHPNHRWNMSVKLPRRFPPDHTHHRWKMICSVKKQDSSRSCTWMAGWQHVTAVHLGYEKASVLIF